MSEGGAGEKDVNKTSSQEERETPEPGKSEDGPGLSEDGPGLSEAEPGLSEDGPGLSEDGPGLSEDGPGESEAGPGLSEAEPGLSEDGPGLSEAEPGLSEAEPGLSEDGPGLSEDGPGESEAGPGESEDGPGLSEDGPGLSEAEPGLSEDGPGLSKAEPGLSEAEPGLSKAEPGLSEAEPGLSEAEPGLSEAEPGLSEAEPGLSEAEPGLSEDGPGMSEDEPGESEAGPGEREAGPGMSEAGPGESEAGPELSEAGPELSEAEPGKSEAEPELSEAEPGKSEAGPELSEAGPELSEAEPGKSEAGPELSEAEPGKSEAEPQLSEAGPELSEAEPGKSEAGPELSEAEPGKSEAEPQLSEAGPELSEAGPGKSDVGQGGGSEVPDEKEMPPNTLCATATVKVRLLPEGNTLTMALSLNVSVFELKQLLAKELKVSPNILIICLQDSVVDDNKTLFDLGVQPHGSFQLELCSCDPMKYPIQPITAKQEFNMPDVITVCVPTEHNRNAHREVVVEVERVTHTKPFLGGYKNRETGLEFHHAAVQTRPKRRPDRGVEVFCRETQTVCVKSQSQQCSSDKSTQMTKIGCYVSNTEDRLVSPGLYVTAAQYHQRRLQAVMVLQKHVRRWRAQCRVARLRQKRDRRLAWLLEEEERKRQEKENQGLDEYYRRLNPNTAEDFTLLYNAVEKWKQEELEHINNTLSGPERKTALCVLLEEETHLIASIGRQRVLAGERNRPKILQNLLDKCAAPKQWKSFDGKLTQMDTLPTLRARQLRDLYNDINATQISMEQRLKYLQILKQTVMEHDCKLSQEVVQLAEREVDLLSRGVRKSNLQGLRQRISTLFLQFIRTPAFNPEVSKHLKVPQDHAAIRHDVFYCRSCCTFLPAADFSLVVNAETMGRCRRCARLENDAGQRQDLSLYRKILHQLRDTETIKEPTAKIPYLLQEEDLRYLVEVIWKDQSILSAWDNLHDLIMTRWESHIMWSPWNCILLSKDEAHAHLNINDITTVYTAEFIRNVRYKHLLAREYFSQIPTMMQMLQEKDLQPALVVTPITVAPSPK